MCPRVAPKFVRLADGGTKKYRGTWIPRIRGKEGYLGRVMALDVGTKTIGIALSDPLRMFAKPLRTLSRKGVQTDVMGLLGVIGEHSVDHVVVGLPYELDGTEARSAKLARQIGEALSERGHAITYIDERYSSVEAERFLIQAGVGATRRKQVIDQAAACVILQSFLDHGDWTRDSASTNALPSSNPSG